MCLRISVVILSFLLSTISFAQWKLIAPNLVGVSDVGGGAMCYQSVIVWAANRTSIWFSTDLGETWSDRSPQLLPPDTRIYDIEFFDQRTGVFCTWNNIFRTTDQGITWT